jgi:hypothetical protein
MRRAWLERTKFREFVDSAREELSRALTPHGFEETPLFEVLDKLRKFHWPRREEWKVDAVELWYRKTMPDALSVSLRIYLPGERVRMTGETELGLLFDGIELDALTRRSRPYYVKGLLVTPDRLASRIAKDVERGLHWFEAFQSPGECRQRLEAGKTMWGSGSSKVHDELRSRLQGE